MSIKVKIVDSEEYIAPEQLKITQSTYTETALLRYYLFYFEKKQYNAVEYETTTEQKVYREELIRILEIKELEENFLTSFSEENFEHLLRVARVARDLGPACFLGFVNNIPETMQELKKRKVEIKDFFNKSGISIVV